MRKIIVMILSAVLVLSLTACSSKNIETKTGKANGFGGVLDVTVELEGSKIISVTIGENNETPTIAKDALENIPKEIVSKNSPDVDIVSGATYTSNAIINAVKNAIDPAKYPYEAVAEKEKETVDVNTADASYGMGVVSTGRLGPGKDDTETQVYSFNNVVANVLFDGDGKILELFLDQLEVATPNYDGDGMPHFTGFGGQEYNADENHDGKIDTVLVQNDDTFLAEVASWTTKRERGDKYVMGTGTWAEQADAYGELFRGKTVAEVKEWYETYTQLNGRPLNITDKSKDEDKAKYDALTQEEKDMLADVTTTATMSLNDSHGNLIAAIEKAYENRIGLENITATSAGFGVVPLGRLGPGKDDQDTQVYSFNVVYAFALYDGDQITFLNLDQLEVATPNYDGDGMPHFTGFGGQEYNADENHDEKVDTVLVQNDDTFLEQIASWTTKRERGDKYVMGTGTWSEQADAYAELFSGKSVAEVKEWYETYTQLNGRPLNITDKSKDEDKAKYDALTQEQKDMLADVITTATMSLNDSHGNLIEAIEETYNNRYNFNLTVE